MDLQEEEQAELLSGELSKGVLDGDEVLKRLGHLEAVNVKMTRVEEVVHPLLAVEARLGLSKLIVVVRELEISTCQHKSDDDTDTTTQTVLTINKEMPIKDTPNKMTYRRSAHRERSRGSLQPWPSTQCASQDGPYPTASPKRALL